MSTDVRALLIFCEGPHDSAFIRMIFEKVMGYSREQKIHLSAMPSPFDNLFARSVKKHAAGDMSLDMAHAFFLPDVVLRKEDRTVFIFKTGGKYGERTITRFLSDFLPLYRRRKIYLSEASEAVHSAHYLFLYDADTDGIDKVAKELSSRLAKVGGEEFIVNSWSQSASEFGKVSGDKAIFVWGKTPDAGTLEDVVMPLFDKGPKAKIAAVLKEAMQTAFEWDFDNENPEKAMKESASYRKAVITAVGQREKPGGSMSVVLEQAGILTDDDLRACPAALEFSKFIEEFWR